MSCVYVRLLASTVWTRLGRTVFVGGVREAIRGGFDVTSRWLVSDGVQEPYKQGKAEQKGQHAGVPGEKHQARYKHESPGHGRVPGIHQPLPQVVGFHPPTLAAAVAPRGGA